MVWNYIFDPVILITVTGWTLFRKTGTNVILWSERAVILTTFQELCR